MTAEPFIIAQRRQAVVYDGTNSADIAALIDNFDIINVDGSGVLTFYSPADPAFWSANPGDYILYNFGFVFDVLSPGSYDNQWVCSVTCADVPDITGLTAALEDLQTQVDELAGGAVHSVGAGSVGTLLPAASITIAVPLTPAMPAASGYTVTPLIFGGLNLGALDITDVTIVDADTVNVTVENTGLLSLGGAHVLLAAKV